MRRDSGPREEEIRETAADRAEAKLVASFFLAQRVDGAAASAASPLHAGVELSASRRVGPERVVFEG